MPIPTPSAHTSVFIFLLNNPGAALDRRYARECSRSRDAHYTQLSQPRKGFEEDFFYYFLRQLEVLQSGPRDSTGDACLGFLAAQEHKRPGGRVDKRRSQQNPRGVH